MTFLLTYLTITLKSQKSASIWHLRRGSLRERNVVSCFIFPAYLLPVKLLFLTLWVGVQGANRKQGTERSYCSEISFVISRTGSCLKLILGLQGFAWLVKQATTLSATSDTGHILYSCCHLSLILRFLGHLHHLVLSVRPSWHLVRFLESWSHSVFNSLWAHGL